MSMLPQPWRRESYAVYYTDRLLGGLDEKAISFLADNLPNTPRQRLRICTHINVDAPFQEMIIALGAAGYVRPHRHPDKVESLHVIKGAAVLVFFDLDGRIVEHLRLGPYESGACWYYRIGEPIYHTLLPQSNCFIFHESTTGPFEKGDTEFADWAPDETDHDVVAAYVKTLQSQLDL